MASVRTVPLPALPEAILGGTVTGLGLDHAGSVIVLAAEGRWPEAPIGFGASQPYRHSVARQRGTGYELFTFMGSRHVFEFAQPLRRGRWLLATSSRGDDSASVSSRLFASIGRRVFDLARPRLHDRRLLAASSRFGHEDTSVEFASDGEALDVFGLGPAIVQLQVTKDESVWVGYGDESLDGLSRFSSGGQLQYEFGGSTGVGWMDCYALNVADDAVWTCYYPGFPLVRITQDGSSTWSTPGYGSEAIAVDGERVAFMGSYERRDRLYLCDIPSFDTREAAVVERAAFQVSDPDGRPMGAAKVAGRGTKLVFYLDGRLSALDIREL